MDRKAAALLDSLGGNHALVDGYHRLDQAGKADDRASTPVRGDRGELRLQDRRALPAMRGGTGLGGRP